MRLTDHWRVQKSWKIFNRKDLFQKLEILRFTRVKANLDWAFSSCFSAVPFSSFDLCRRDDDDDDDDDRDDDYDDDLHLHVLPEVLSLDLHGRSMELLGSFLSRLKNRNFFRTLKISIVTFYNRSRFI